MGRKQTRGWVKNKKTAYSAEDPLSLFSWMSRFVGALTIDLRYRFKQFNLFGDNYSNRHKPTIEGGVPIYQRPTVPGQRRRSCLSCLIQGCGSASSTLGAGVEYLTFAETAGSLEIHNFSTAAPDYSSNGLKDDRQGIGLRREPRVLRVVRKKLPPGVLSITNRIDRFM